jgi:type IV secretory pathway VirB10-like protein
VEAAAPLIGFARRHDLTRDRDALVVAGLLSLLLHLALLKWFVGYSQTPAINPPAPETEITLASPSDIESDKPPAAKTAPPPSTPNSAPEIQARLPPTDGAPPEARREPQSDAWAQSRVILSSQELADPRNRKAAESLKHLEPQTRSQQLCDFEAILQINRQFNEYAVDFVVAYASEAAVRKGGVVIAHGAAFHSNGRWYNLAFECQLSTSQRDVAHLRFKVGDAIPSEQWADLNLPRTPANPLGGD